MAEDDIEWKSFTIISIDSLLVHKSMYYLQVYIDNCIYEASNKEIADYLDENGFED